METQSPFSLLEGLFRNLPLPNFQPPVWAVDEAQRRIVLLLNHILIQEKEATSRLARQKGRGVLMQWRSFTIELVATPAGLLDRAPVGAKPDLVLAVTEESPLALAQAVLRGTKPTVRIEGDVQLAAELNWLVDHVRWDMEEDLAKIIGDAPAHGLGQAARGMANALKQFVGSVANGSPKAPT
jgi:ubiquinone biosynthesis protein UbiJ